MNYFTVHLTRRNIPPLRRSAVNYLPGLAERLRRRAHLCLRRSPAGYGRKLRKTQLRTFSRNFAPTNFGHGSCRRSASMSGVLKQEVGVSCRTQRLRQSAALLRKQSHQRSPVNGEHKPAMNTSGPPTGSASSDMLCLNPAAREFLLWEKMAMQALL